MIAALSAVGGVTALDMLCANESAKGPTQRATRTDRGAVRVDKSITVNRLPEELYAFWRNFSALPQFLSHLVSVDVLDERRSLCKARGPAGITVERQAEIIEDKPNEMISWRSLESADVDNAGSVHFERAQGGRGTVARVILQYRAPAGKAGAKLAKLIGRAPEQEIALDLLRFKEIVETGEVAGTEGQPVGAHRTRSKFDTLARG